ncbi:TfdA family Taurine catabolism dioxygenase TauD [Seiridium cupressi]
MPTLEIGRLTEQDKQTLRKALFEDQVIVIRGQKGIEPTVLPELAKVFNESAIGAHSTGEKAVSDSRNILSAYKAGRIPQAPQVGIIGLGKFQDYDGIPKLEVIHLDHTLFHENSSTPEDLQKGYTRPYRWHMDTLFYERLLGEVTVLHSVQIP